MRMFTLWNRARPLFSRQTAAPAVMLAGMLSASPAMAVDLTENVQVHGFASQAYIKTSGNKYFGRSDAGSFDFRELGVNLSWQATPNIQFGAQVGSRRAGGTDDATPRVDYALGDFTLLSGEAGRAGVRVGRHRIPLGFYNLTRDVANARPSIILPESIYSEHARSYFLALDGAQIYEEVRTPVGDFFLDYSAGKFILDDYAKRIGTSATNYVWRLMYERDGGRLRLALTGFDINLDLIAVPFSNPKYNLNVTLLSAQYNAENWSLTGEFSPAQKENLSNLVLPPGVHPLFPQGTRFSDLKKTGQSGYLQGTYNITPDWTALLRYDVSYPDRNNKAGANRVAGVGGFTSPPPGPSAFAKDWTAGIGWKVRPDTRIRAEWHHINGTAWVYARENPIKGNIRQHWDMFFLQASYSF